MATHLEIVFGFLEPINGFNGLLGRLWNINQIRPCPRNGCEEGVAFRLGYFEVWVTTRGVLMEFLRIDANPAFDTNENVELRVDDRAVPIGGAI